MIPLLTDPLERLRHLGISLAVNQDDLPESFLPPRPEPLCANPMAAQVSAQAAVKRKGAKKNHQLAQDRAGPTAAQVEAFDGSELIPGESYPGMELTSWKFVQIYPDRFIGKKNKPRARPFFDDLDKDRTWHFFYIYHPDKPSSAPILFVPAAEFVFFLGYVNAQLNTKLTIPPGHEDMFNMVFGPGAAFAPRFLGSCRRSEDFELLTGLMISPEEGKDNDTASSEAGKNVLRKHLALVATDRIAQATKSSAAAADRATMMSNLQRWLREPRVFVSVDTETIESIPGALSEVGLAFLDMREHGSILPGPGGHAWLSKMHCYHVRVSEYANFRNHQFVHGCPDMFNFGKSSFARTSELPAAIEQIIDNHIAAKPGSPAPKVVLVGHDVWHDVIALQRVKVPKIGEISQIIDTKCLHQHWSRATQPTSLIAVLGQLGIEHENLHNAGNDAAYTLHATVALALTEPPSQEGNHEAKTALSVD